MWLMVVHVSVGAWLYINRSPPGIQKHSGLRTQKLRARASVNKLW